MAENPPHDPPEDRPAGASTPQGTRSGFPSQGLHVPAPVGGWSLDEYNPTGFSPVGARTWFGMDLAPAGDLFFTVDAELEVARRYPVDPPGDLSTVEFDGYDQEAALPAGAQNPFGLEFNPDRDRMFWFDSGLGAVVAVDLDQPNTLSGLTLAEQSPSASGIRDWAFNPTGDKAVVAGAGLTQVSWGAPYDITTITGSSLVASSETDSVQYGDEGKHLYAVHRDTSTPQPMFLMARYTLGTPGDASTAGAPDQRLAPYPPANNDSVGGLIFSDPSTMWLYAWTNTGLNVDGLYKWEVAPAAPGFQLDDSIWRSRLAEYPDLTTGVAFDDDGSKLFVMNSTGTSPTTISEYNLGVNYNIRTMPDSPAATLEIDGTMQSIKFKPDGTRMYVATNGGSIVAYELTTAYSLDTASELNFGNYNVFGFDISPPGVWEFQDDEYQVLITADDDQAHMYPLMEDWDIASGALFQSVGLEQTGAAGITFADNGSSIIYTTDAPSAVRQVLDVPYDLSTIQSLPFWVFDFFDDMGASWPMDPTFPDPNHGGRFVTTDLTEGDVWEWTGLGLPFTPV